MKTQDELLEHYWSVIVPMARNHGVKPWECVRSFGKSDWSKRPEFTDPPKYYTFAITILEGKPVFYDSEIYSKYSGNRLIAGEIFEKDLSADFFTWTPPAKKRTFVLNCVELPCPIQNSIGCRLDFLGVDYHFETVQDRNKVADAISNILNQSRDKE